MKLHILSLAAIIAACAVSTSRAREIPSKKNPFTSVPAKAISSGTDDQKTLLSRGIVTTLPCRVQPDLAIVAVTSEAGETSTAITTADVASQIKPSDTVHMLHTSVAFGTLRPNGEAARPLSGETFIVTGLEANDKEAPQLPVMLAVNPGRITSANMKVIGFEKVSRSIALLKVCGTNGAPITAFLDLSTRFNNVPMPSVGDVVNVALITGQIPVVDGNGKPATVAFRAVFASHEALDLKEVKMSPSLMGADGMRGLPAIIEPLQVPGAKEGAPPQKEGLGRPDVLPKV